MQKSTVKKLNVTLFSILIILFITLGIWYRELARAQPKSFKNGKVFVVTRTDKGFSPKNVTLKKNDTILFKTNQGKMFWPASDNHPVHTIYSEFDSKRPIPAGQSWSFTFKKEGTWGFHDHLNPYSEGKITVGNDEKLQKNTQSGMTCMLYQNIRQKTECYKSLVKNTFEKEGGAKSFDMIGSLYKKEAQFASECHTYTHYLGRLAYTRFAETKNTDLSDKNASCAYGFYHGFMEELFRTKGNIRVAQDFCNLVKTQQTLVLTQACFHGIGHGTLATQISDSDNNTQILINKAINLCRNATTPTFLTRCTSGIFMELSQYYIEDTYKLPFNKNDPLVICRFQEKQFQLDCYTQMNGVINWLSKNDYKMGVRYLNGVNDEYRKEAVLTFVGAGMNPSQNQHYNVTQCRSLEEMLQIPCIKGLSLGYVLKSLPGTESLQAINFCRSTYLTNIESSTCISFILEYLKNLYTRDMFLSICRSENLKKESLCSSALNSTSH